VKKTPGSREVFARRMGPRISFGPVSGNRPEVLEYSITSIKIEKKHSTPDVMALSLDSRTQMHDVPERENTKMI